MSVSVIIITENEESMIVNSIHSVKWADEIIVVDQQSDDMTVDLAKREGAIVVSVDSAEKDFAELRNRGLEKAKGDWVFYLDADERVTPHLYKEISRVMRSQLFDAYLIPRTNIHYGAWMRFGGWDQDLIIRLIRRSAISKWSGVVHEHVEFIGETGTLLEPIIHLTHRNFMDGLQKTVAWTPLEAKLLLDSKHPKMNSFRFFRVFFGSLFYRFVWKKGWRDGVRGTIESFTQAINRFIVYEQLWEPQQNPSLEDQYAEIDESITKLWEKERAQS